MVSKSTSKKFRFRVTGARGAVYETTTYAEAKRLAGKRGVIERIGNKNPHCVSNPSVPKRFTTDEGFTIELTGNNTWLDGSKAGDGWVSGWVREWQGHQPDPTPYVLVQFQEDTSHVPTSVSVTIANGDPDKRDYEPVDAGYIVNEYLAANPVDRPYNHGDEYEVGDTVYDRDTGEPWEVERVFNKSATTFVALGSNDGRYSMPQVRYQDVPNMFSATPVAPQSNPHLADTYSKVHAILKKEGGAAGLKALRPAFGAGATNIDKALPPHHRVPGVVRHGDGDYLKVRSGRETDVTRYTNPSLPSGMSRELRGLPVGKTTHVNGKRVRRLDKDHWSVEGMRHKLANATVAVMG